MIKVQEAKQVGILYHYTSYWHMFDILKDNTFMIASEHAVSFTRDRNFHRIARDLSNINVRFVIDGDKLSEHYKIEPFNYYDKKKHIPLGFANRSAQKNLESEERVVNRNIENAKAYIIKIEFLSYVLEDPTMKSKILFRLRSWNNIEFNDSPTLMEDIARYVQEKYGVPCSILQTRTSKESLIRESPEYSNLSTFNHFVGWWVGAGKNSGKVYRVKKEEEGDTHLRWAAWNIDKLLGPEAKKYRDILLLGNYSDGLFNYVGLIKNCYDPKVVSHLSDFLKRTSPEQYSSFEDIYYKVWEQIYDGWVRATYDKHFGYMYFQVKSADKVYYDAVMSCLMGLGEESEICKVYVETFDNQVIWQGVYWSQAIKSNSFRKLYSMFGMEDYDPPENMQNPGIFEEP